MDLKIIMPDFPVVYSVLRVILPSSEDNGDHPDFKLGLLYAFNMSDQKSHCVGGTTRKGGHTKVYELSRKTDR